MPPKTLDTIANEIVERFFDAYLPIEKVFHCKELGELTEQQEADLNHEIYYQIHKRCHQFMREKNGRRPE